MPSPMYPTTWRFFFSARMMRSFWLGSTSANRVVVSIFFHNASSFSLPSSAPVRVFVTLQTHGFGHMLGNKPVIPRDDPELDAEVSQLGDCLRHIRLWGVKEQQESDKGHTGFVFP